MKRAIYLFLLLCFFATNSTAQDRDISYMSSGGELNSLQANMDIRHYTLSLDVDIANESIAGYVTINFILQQPTDTVLVDLVHFLNVTKISTSICISSLRGNLPSDCVAC